MSIETHLIGQLKKCHTCGKIGEFKVCGKCKLFAYCSQDCQRTHWRSGHKENCGKTSADEFTAILMPENQDLEQHEIRLSKKDYISDAQNILKCKSVVQAKPVRGEPDQITNIVLLLDSEAKKKKSLQQNMRSSIILTPQNVERGNLFAISGDERKAMGDVIAVKFDANNQPIDFTLDQFNLIWGLMVIIPSNSPKYATGSILPKTDEYAQSMASIIQNANMARMANANKPRKQKRTTKKKNSQEQDFENFLKMTQMMNQFSSYDSDEDDGGCYGFSADEVNELLSQGVKPWDDDAADVLAALNGHY